LPLRRKIPLVRQYGPSGCNYQSIKGCFGRKGVKLHLWFPAKCLKMNRP
jgi:hypothetical protein